MLRYVAGAALAVSVLAGCTARPAPSPNVRLFSALSALCGQAFEGEVEVDRSGDGTPADPDSPWATERIVMHVRECGPDAIRVPLHVGADRSRTWVVSRLGDGGLRLKHDHRHEDGSEDAVTQYGGDTDGPGMRTQGGAWRAEFPVDAESVATFRLEGLEASLRNVWAMEVVPGERFTYELARPSGRLFRVRFDLGDPVALPPPPWGGED